MLPRSNLISVTVFEIFRVKILTVDLMTLAGLTPGLWSPKGEMTYRPPRSAILQNFSPIAGTMVEICVTKVFQFLALGGLTPGPKFTKRGDDLSEVYHPAKFHCSTPTHARDIPYKKSCGHTHTHTKTNSNRYIPTCRSLSTQL